MVANVRIDIIHGESNSKNLIVYLPGILAGAESSAVDLIPIWLKAGDVMLVEYGKEKFDANLIESEVLLELRDDGYLNDPDQMITFIGSSMGGLIAYDVLESIENSNTDDRVKAKINLILLDAPTCRQDFQSPNDVLSPILVAFPFGPNWDRILRFVIPVFYVQPKEQNIEPSVNRAVLKARVDEAKSYRLSFWRDEVKFIVEHGIPNDESLGNLVGKVIYVRSIRDDDTVRFDAYYRWERVFPQAAIFYVDSTHEGFAERPETWRQTFREIFNVQ
jgi:hypothetical protein